MIAKGAIILILALAAPTLQASREKAVGLNSAGYDAYEQGNYSQARELFGAAIQEDDTYIYAHHNYACVLALTYRAGDTAALQEIITHLKRTIELDKKRIQKILSDSDLDAVRGEPAFIAFITDGRGITGSFADPCSGDLYPCYCFSFNEQGAVAMGEGREMVPCSVVRRGRYAVMDSDIILYIPGYSKPQYCEEVPATSEGPGGGVRGERSDDFLWGKRTGGGVDLRAEGFSLIDAAKIFSNPQCVEP